MFGLNRQSHLEVEIDRLITDLETYPPCSTEYTVAAKNLETLYQAQNVAQKGKLSKDAILSSATSLGGIVMILVFEKTEIITTKALSFVTKARL